jgi:deoxyribonuclease V
MTGQSSSWNGDVPAARALQAELASRVLVRDGFVRPLRTVAGCDVRFEDQGASGHATVVVLDADTLEPVEQRVACLAATMPYVPGLLSFRVLPMLLAAFSQLSRAPDLLLVPGSGIAHPYRFGIAAHLGVATGVPSIGVARNVLTGTSVTQLHEMRGAFVPLRQGREQIGWLLRSKVGADPLVVSPGHRVAMASTAELVMRFVTGFRLPEPIRLAAQPDSPDD